MFGPDLSVWGRTDPLCKTIRDNYDTCHVRYRFDERSETWSVTSEYVFQGAFSTQTIFSRLQHCAIRTLLGARDKDRVIFKYKYKRDTSSIRDINIKMMSVLCEPHSTIFIFASLITTALDKDQQSNLQFVIRLIWWHDVQVKFAFVDKGCQRAFLKEMILGRMRSRPYGRSCEGRAGGHTVNNTRDQREDHDDESYETIRQTM